MPVNIQNLPIIKFKIYMKQKLYTKVMKISKYCYGEDNNPCEFCSFRLFPRMTLLNNSRKRSTNAKDYFSTKSNL